MKKFLIVLCSIFMLLGLIGCKDKTPGGDNPGEQQIDIIDDSQSLVSDHRGIMAVGVSERASESVACRQEVLRIGV